MKLQLGATTALTITLNSLANGAARQSAIVDNTTDLFFDAEVDVTVKTGAGSLATYPAVTVYAYRSLDGTTWPDGIGAGNVAWSPPTNITGRRVGQIPIDAAGTAKCCNIASIANAFGGVLPPYWTLAFVNATGLALDSSAGGTVNYRGVTTQ